MFDSVKCTTVYQPTASTAVYSVDDYVSSLPFYLDPTGGTFRTSVSKHLDTAQGGSSDWKPSPDEEDNSMDCSSSSYCKFICTVYRELLTESTQTDVQYSDTGTLKANGGYRMWPTLTATLASVQQGISMQADLSYGGAMPGAQASLVILAFISVQCFF